MQTLNVNRNLLAQQRARLNEIIDNHKLTSAEREGLEGIQNMLDDVSDALDTDDGKVMLEGRV